VKRRLYYWRIYFEWGRVSIVHFLLLTHFLPSKENGEFNLLLLMNDCFYELQVVKAESASNAKNEKGLKILAFFVEPDR
jgi:hypothetical protein